MLVLIWLAGAMSAEQEVARFTRWGSVSPFHVEDLRRMANELISGARLVGDYK